MLRRVYEWMNCNYLTLNLTKTSFTIIILKNIPYNPNIQLNNTIIEECKCFKFLGVLIDPRLSFSKHIEYFNEKISKTR